MDINYIEKVDVRSYINSVCWLQQTLIEHLPNFTFVLQVYRNIGMYCLHVPFLFYKLLVRYFLIGKSPWNQ